MYLTGLTTYTVAHARIKDHRKAKMHIILCRGLKKEIRKELKKDKERERKKKENITTAN